MLQEQQQRTRAAAARIWINHRLYMNSLSLRWLRGDRSEAEDAVSDVIYKASVAFGSGQYDVVNERAWLTRVLHNRCMDAHRRRHGLQSFDSTADADADSAPDGAETDRSAEDLLLNKELGEMLMRALAELPDTLRAPVKMRLIDQDSYGSISEIMRISEANARKRIQQAREILRRRMETYMQGIDGRLTPRRSPAVPTPRPKPNGKA